MVNRWKIRGLIAGTLALGLISAPPPALAADAPAPRTLTGAYLGGVFAVDNADLAAAATLLIAAHDRDPDNPALTHQAFLAAIRAGLMEEAVTLAKAVEANEPNHQFAGLLLLVDQIRQGNWQQAEERLAGLERTGISRYALPLIEAWLLAETQQTEAAIQALAPLDGTPGFAAMADFHTGLILDRRGDLEAALIAYEDAVGASGNGLHTRALVSALSRLGLFDEALAAFDAFAANRPDDFDLPPETRDIIAGGEGLHPPIVTATEAVGESFFRIAEALMQEEAYELALIFARFSAFVHPGARGELIAGDVLYSAGMDEAALAAYQDMEGGGVVERVSSLRQALTLRRMERHEEALALLDALPDSVDALLYRADTLRLLGEWEPAVEAYDAAAERLPRLAEEDWSFLYRRGIALERSGQYERAEQDMTRAIRLNPTHGHLLNYLGYSWADRGVNLAAAEELILQAADIHPGDGFIADSVGWIYYRTGRLEEAVEWLERAVALEPANAVINDHLGDAYWMSNRKREARFQWRRALEWAADSEEPGLEAAIKAKLEDGLADAGMLESAESRGTEASRAAEAN